MRKLLVIGAAFMSALGLLVAPMTSMASPTEPHIDDGLRTYCFNINNTEVSCSNSGAMVKVTITPRGLTAKNADPFVDALDGAVRITSLDNVNVPGVQVNKVAMYTRGSTGVISVLQANNSPAYSGTSGTAYSETGDYTARSGGFRYVWVEAEVWWRRASDWHLFKMQLPSHTSEPIYQFPTAP